jgi:hypothetical protein
MRLSPRLLIGYPLPKPLNYTPKHLKNRYLFILNRKIATIAPLFYSKPYKIHLLPDT